MFPARYFPARYFPLRYWPKVGSAPPTIIVGRIDKATVTCRVTDKATVTCRPVDSKNV